MRAGDIARLDSQRVRLVYPIRGRHGLRWGVEYLDTPHPCLTCKGTGVTHELVEVEEEALERLDTLFDSERSQ